VRRREDYVIEKILCEKKVVWCYSVCSRFQHSRRSQETGPPLHVERSSSGHFPPPRTPEHSKNTKANIQYNKNLIVLYIALGFLSVRCAGGESCPNDSSPALHSVGGHPPTPHPPKAPKVEK
jgi:hypothetical protein